MKKILVIAVLTSLTVGVYAQCDSMVIVVGMEIDPHLKKPFDPSDFTVVPTDDPAPDTNIRRIYFIHGLGGDATAWEKVAEACDTKLGIKDFPARKCFTARPEYSSNSRGSLNTAAKYIRGEMSKTAADDSLTHGMPPSQSIIIAHSQGGLVARQLMHLDLVAETWALPKHGMSYGGVVMVASPLQGAKILANRDYIFTMVNNGCKQLARGWSREIKDLPLVGKWLSGMFDNLTKTVCNVATNNIMPMFFKEYYDGITNDYNPSMAKGINTINMLNQDNSTDAYCKLPKMAFYAVEPQDNIFWRTLNYMYYNPNGNNGKDGPDFEHFGANDDWYFYKNEAKPIINLYKVITEAYQAEYERLWEKYFKYGCIYEKRMENAREHYFAWGAGYDWIKNINTNWEIIIGARECEKMPYPSNPTHPQPKWKCDLKHENDGVVLAESAADLPCATHKPVRIYPKEFETNAVNRGSSHMQVRNDEGLKEHLNKLLNGDYGKWFRTVEQ